MTRSSRSKYQVYKEASLSQKLAYKDEREAKRKTFSEYAGADPQTSIAIARLNVLADFGIIDRKSRWFKLAKAMLNEKRKALFATSDKTNEITKMGLMQPKAEDIISDFDEEE